MYKTFKQERTVPEGHFQNCWQNGGLQQTGAKRAKVSTESQNGLNGESPAHCSVTSHIGLLSQKAESHSKAFNSPFKSVKFLGLVSQTIYCWWQVRKLEGKAMPCIQIKKKKRKKNDPQATAKASRWKKQLGFQATYYNWLPLDNPFLLTNWSSWLVQKTLNKTTATQLCKIIALLNCFLILKHQLGKLKVLLIGLIYRYSGFYPFGRNCLLLLRKQTVQHCQKSWSMEAYWDLNWTFSWKQPTSDLSLQWVTLGAEYWSSQKTSG